MTRLEIAARIAAGMATNGNYSLPGIAEVSLEIADELIRLESETRHKQELPFEMVLGGLYKDREGSIEEIVGSNAYNVFSFIGKSGRRYTKKGICNIANHAEFDLIKRIR